MKFLITLALMAASASAFTTTQPPLISLTKHHDIMTQPNLSKLQMSRDDTENEIHHPSATPSRRTFITSAVMAAASGTFVMAMPEMASARLDPVNRPDLLPSEPGKNVIQIEKFLTSGQVRRMDELLSNLEKDTGFRLRVLCQSYPNTPGLAVRDYWDLGKEVRLPFLDFDLIELKVLFCVWNVPS